jgi:hypothetical protein
MGHFALLESGINMAIGEVLDIRGIRSAIVTRNMGFDEKVKTLRTLVNLFVYDSKLAKRFDEAAKQAQKSSILRNVIAHNVFRRSEKTGGVEFFMVKASNKFEVPELDWSIEQFFEQIGLIEQTDRELRLIEEQMPFQRIAMALIKSMEASETSASATLGGLYGLTPVNDGNTEDSPSKP